MSLRRVGYDPRALDQIIGPNGDILNLLDISPWAFKQCITLDVKAWQLQQLAEGSHADVSQGVFITHLRRCFANGKGGINLARRWEPLSSDQKGYARSVFVNGQWPNDRRYADAPRISRTPCCQLHPGVPGTLWHRHTGCQESWPSFTLPAEIAKLVPFDNSITITTLVERLILPEPLHMWRPPGDDLLAHVQWIKGGDGFPFMNTTLYSDGAVYEAGLSLAASACGIAELPEGGEDWDPGHKSTVKALGAPLPGPLQSIDGAELLGLLVILKHSLPPITAAFDASYVTKGLIERGRAGTAKATSAWGCVWRRVWQALDDFGGIGDQALTIKKVKAHSSVANVQNGLISARDRRGNMEADRCAKFVADAVRSPLEDRRAWQRRALTLDGVVFWVARAGNEAADLKLDIDLECKPQRKGPPISITRHDPIKVPGGGVHCTFCLRTAYTEQGIKRLLGDPCVAKPFAPEVNGAKRRPAASALPAAGAVAAALAAARRLEREASGTQVDPPCGRIQCD